MDEEDKIPDTKAICKKCLKERVRNPAGFFGNGRDRRYTDQHNAQWNGKVCPKCQRDKMKTHMKVKRKKDLQ